MKKISNEEVFGRIQSGEEFVIRKCVGSRTYELTFGDEQERHLVDEKTGKKIIETEIDDYDNQN